MLYTLHPDREPPILAPRIITHLVLCDGGTGHPDTGPAFEVGYAFSDAVIDICDGQYDRVCSVLAMDIAAGTVIDVSRAVAQAVADRTFAERATTDAARAYCDLYAVDTWFDDTPMFGARRQVVIDRTGARAS